METLRRIFLPDVKTTSTDRILVISAWIVLGFLLWQFNDNIFFPKPLAVLHAFERIREQGLLLQFGVSLWTMMWAIIWTLVISHTLAYLSALSAFRPLATFVTGWRYFGFVGLLLPLTLLFPDGGTLKIVMLSYGMSVFYLSSLLGIVQNIPEEQYDHARVLGLSQTRMIYEVAIRGTLYNALIAFSSNSAMAWMMLTTVEGVVRSQGGIGAVLINMDRHADLGQMFAILVIIFCLGRFQDVVITAVTNYIICPYARLGKGR